MRAILLLLLLVWPSAALTQPPDRPYRGKLTVQQLDPVRLAAVCQRQVGLFQVLAGCAIVGRGWCRVYLHSLQDTNALRHEIAHCNGWRHP